MPIRDLPINQWNDSERPREKFASKGASALTDAELVAILLGSGSGKKSAIDLAHEILEQCGYNLNKLGRLGIKELMKFSGVGLAKAVSVASGIELGRRIGNFTSEEVVITQSIDAYKVLRHDLEGKPHEEFHVLYLNNANVVVGKTVVGKGGLASTVADGKIIFKEALLHSATGIILAHNHPSGNLYPSQPDRRITAKVKEFGKYIDINVLDHLIISNKGYYSFADKGQL